MRHILTLVDGRVVGLAALLLASAALVAFVVGRRNGPAWHLFIALGGTALIATMTIGNRGIVVSTNGLADDFTWWTRNWGTLPSLMSVDLGWWLNVALFVPAALGWTLVTMRPLAVSVVLALVVFAIETLQATVLSGAGDPTDVVANALGIALGVGAAFAWSRRSRTTAIRQPQTTASRQRSVLGTARGDARSGAPDRARTCLIDDGRALRRWS
jgi:hypothetical protein